MVSCRNIYFPRFVYAIGSVKDYIFNQTLIRDLVGGMCLMGARCATNHSVQFWYGENCIYPAIAAYNLLNQPSSSAVLIRIEHGLPTKIEMH